MALRHTGNDCTRNFRPLRYASGSGSPLMPKAGSRGLVLAACLLIVAAVAGCNRSTSPTTAAAPGGASAAEQPKVAPAVTEAGTSASDRATETSEAGAALDPRPRDPDGQVPVASNDSTPATGDAPIAESAGSDPEVPTAGSESVRPGVRPAPAADVQPVRPSALPTAAAPSRASAIPTSSQASAGRTRELTFDDIKFDMEKGDPFDRSLLTPEIEALHGQRVRIRGFILPSFQQRGIKQFVLVRDNMECCFGPGAALYDCIYVEMQPGRTANFSIYPVAVEGIFHIREWKGPDGKHLAIYQMDGISVE